MSYNAIDLIDKAINIAIKEKSIYKNIAKENDNIPSIKIISNVLIKQVDKDIQHYKNLKKQIIDSEPEEIDFGIYDKMSFLINQFNKKIYVTKVVNIKDFLKFSLNFQKDLYALLIDLQGRCVKSSLDIDTKAYKALSNMINNIDNHISTLEKILR